jgi:hypothetical protein
MGHITQYMVIVDCVALFDTPALATHVLSREAPPLVVMVRYSGTISSTARNRTSPDIIRSNAA